MTDSMVERVARAIYANRFGPDGRECLMDEPWHAAIDAARAAIAAMREPTAIMVQQGAKTIVAVTDEPRDFHPAKVAYQAMIDEALKHAYPVYTHDC